jgi:hypothetical protein
MKTTYILRRILISFGFVVTSLIVWLPPAQAASIDDFISVYQKIESAAPPGSLPVSTADVKAYKSLFQCVEGGGDVLVCSNQFHQTDAGKKATGDIPEAVWQVVDAYVAWKAGDTWGVVEHLGAAAMCAVLQVLAGGFDACGLIKDLIAVGEAFLDAGKAVAEFFKDLGEGAANLAKGVYCALGGVFGGCDDPGPPPKPAAQVIYEKFFAPKVLPDGLSAIESDDGWAFDKLLKQLSAQAKAKGYSDGDISTASDIFTKAVDAQWTADIVQNVLKKLAAERSTFNAPWRISLASDYAWAEYNKKPQGYPPMKVPLWCASYFTYFGFAHVTRWIFAHADKAQALQVQGGYQWCDKVFWEGNKTQFAEYFKKLMETKCPGLGCSSKADRDFCHQFMATVGLNCVISAKFKDSPPPVVKLPSGIIAAVVAKPNLSVTGVQVKIEPNCQASQPAMTASVTIKNTGGALAGNRGTVSVKEQGGTSLGSAGIQIPAIGAGQTQVVNIPSGTRQPYSSLAGRHKVQVNLNPQSESGQLSFNKPADPYMFSAVFPSGHCKSTQQQPAQQQQQPGAPGRR